MTDPEEEILQQALMPGTEEEVYQAEGTEDTEDGGAIVDLGPDEPEKDKPGFYSNLVSMVPSGDLGRLSIDLLDKIERDKKSRAQRDKDYEEAIRRTGLGDEAPGGATFHGASKVVHPMLTEACVDFSSRAIPELLPPGGPVQSFVPGDNPDKERLDKADRKKAYMNWQFTVQMPEIRAQLEQLLTQLPLGGSQYMRMVFDEDRGRPVPVYVPSDKVFLPYAASSFHSAERRTFADDITDQEMQIRIDSGMYDKSASTMMAADPEQSLSEVATEKVEGKDKSGEIYEDGVRRIYDTEVSLDLSIGDGGLCPYLVTIDDSSGQILRIIRNWEQTDRLKNRLDWAVEFPFIPWRGAQSIGLGQMIGSLSGAATGALRALLDSAHINNIPTLLRLKGTNLSGQSKELGIGEITEVEGGMQTDDIRKLMMAVPYNPPSPVLQSLLGFLTDAGRGVVRTTFDKLYDSSAHNMPVGTTLALIEEGQKVMSAIHLRLYDSMTQLIKVLHRLNRMYLQDDEVMDEVGEMLAYRQDFQLPLDVVPVADPHIFSDVQRMAQMQVVADRASANPDLYDRRKIEERLLDRARIPNAQELLAPSPDGEPKNAVQENADMALGKPVSAFESQNHLAHISVHIDFMMNPMLGQLPIIAPQFIAACLEHIKEHVVMWYMSESFGMLGDEQEFIDDKLAGVSADINMQAEGRFYGLPDIIGQAIEIMQSMAPAPQLDPNVQAQLEQKSLSDQMRQQTEAAKIQERSQSTQIKGQLDAAKLQAKNDEHVQELQFDLEKLNADMLADFKKLESSEQIARFREAQHNLRQQQELVSRMKELQIEEDRKDDRLAVEQALKDKLNQDDNRAALAVAAAEIETKENISVGGINPDVSPH